MRLLLLVVLFSSCASQVEVYTPSSLFINSKTRKEFLKGDIKVHSINGNLLKLSIPNNTNDIETDNNKSTPGVGLTSQIGLLEALDFIVKLNTHSPNLYGAKAQFFNIERKDLINASAYVMVGQSQYNGSSGDNINIISGDADFDIDRTHSVARYGFVGGVDYGKYLEVYASFGIINEKIHGDIDYPSNALDGKNITVDGDHFIYTLGAQYEYQKVIIQSEIAYTQIDFDKNSDSQISINLGLGTSF